MTAFYLLLPWQRLLLSALLFAAATLEITVCIYRYGNRGKIKSVIFETVVFFMVFAAMTLSMVGEKIAASHVVTHLPWIFYPIIFALVSTQSIICFFAEKKDVKTKLSVNSVKEALDNINCGIIFAFDSERIILINHTMENLMSEIGDEPLLTVDDFRRAVRNGEKNGKLTPTGEMPGLFRFFDGSVRKIDVSNVSGGGKRKFIRITVQNVSEVYSVSAKLKEENAELKITNEKLSEMYDILADRIREEETLNLKLRVHDDIGSSLISISDLINGENDADMQTQLEVLRNAAGYFKSAYKNTYDELDRVREAARRMNARIIFNGEMPRDKSARDIIAAAAHECLTNCINHAGGSCVTVDISQNGEDVLAVFTNDGEKPNDKIVEGGGLSTLRRRVEGCGGKMNISHTPRFALSIIVTVKEKEQ